MPIASIIICTRNRAGCLIETLNEFARLEIPHTLPSELIVVDNASTDGTAEILKNYKPSNLEVRYVFEGRRGQVHARNTGITAARGDVILFTDDDIRPPRDWVQRMTQPILDRRTDAVAGGIHMAPHLVRSWMQPLHRNWLACLEDATGDMDLVGANMSFSRRVLEKVPSFDEELGPGKLGFCDDTLFSFQLREAGFKVSTQLGIIVIHHFQPDRLYRASFLHEAEKHGKTEAYLAYHWQYTPPVRPHRYMVRQIITLIKNRILHRKDCLGQEGAPVWELETIKRIHYCRQTIIESKRPPNYERRGLRKRGGG